MNMERKRMMYKFEDGKELSGKEVRALTDGIESGKLKVVGDKIMEVGDAEKFKVELPASGSGGVLGTLSKVGKAGETVYYGLKRGGFFRWRAKDVMSKDLKGKIGDYLTRNLDCALDMLQQAGYLPEDITAGRVSVDELVNVLDTCSDKKLGLVSENLVELTKEEAERKQKEKEKEES